MPRSPKSDGDVLATDARADRASHDRARPRPSLSVVIPSLDSPLIGETIAAIREQDYPTDDLEVLVVGLDGPGLVREGGVVRRLDTVTPAPPAAARNVGIRQAAGDLVAFTDSDCVPARDWLTRLTAPFATPTVSVVAGGITFPRDDYWTAADAVAHYASWLAEAPSGPRLHLASLNLCARKSVFDEVGLFDETFPHPAGEDTEWSIRARCHGHGLLFVRDALVHHAARRQDRSTALRRARAFGRAAANPALIRHTMRPRALARWQLLAATAPLIAAGVTFRTYLGCRPLLRYWHCAPAVWLLKVAWRLGAADELRASRRQPRDRAACDGPLAPGEQ